MIIVGLCVFLIQGLLVKGFPAVQYESSDGETIADGVEFVKPVVAEDIVENNGSVAAIDTLPESYEKSQESPELSSVSSESTNATENIDLIQTAINEPISVLNMLAEDEGKVNQTLVTVDKVDKSKMEIEDEKNNQPSLKNENFTDVMNSAIHDLLELQSKMASEFLIIKDTIESKMGVIRQQIKSAISENKMVAEAEMNAKKLSNDSVIIQSEIEMAPDMAKTNPLVELDIETGDCNSTPLKFEYDELLLVEEEEIEANLEKINDFIEFELAKIDSFVESELALTEALIQSEVDKMNLLVESKMNTALVDSENNDVESIVESELGIEIPVEGVAEFSGVVPATGRALIFGSTGYSPVLPVLEENAEETVIEEESQRAEVPVVDEVPFTRRLPVSGRTFIFGSTGFLHPNLAPLETHSKKTMERLNTIPISVETGPLTLGSTEYTPNFDVIESVTETKVMLDEDSLMEPIIFNDTSETIPVIGKAVFSGVTPAVGNVKIVGSSGCRPLLPTVETPDGKKYLWIAKRPTTNAPPPVSRIPEAANTSDFPRSFPMVSKYTAEFPETVIMDSTKNYERLIEEYEVLDQEIDHGGEVLVAGEVFFKGKAPATGSVRITGHSIC